MKVTLNYSDKMHFNASTRQFHDIYLDEPESFHGTDLAPSPIEYFLIGTGGCIGSTFIFCLQKYKIAIESFKVIVDGTLKHIDPNKRLKLVKIEVDLVIKLIDSVPNKNIDLCFKTFQQYCPISDVIMQGIPLKVNISKE
ncbi:MAG: OsmC family peroxiredoxin [Promethearchaeota archaeon]|nr:MAG: OsmC family peroxiredoxin [Candidatus Lokiarchaeota archaeon]